MICLYFDSLSRLSWSKFGRLKIWKMLQPRSWRTLFSAHKSMSVGMVRYDFSTSSCVLPYTPLDEWDRHRWSRMVILQKSVSYLTSRFHAFQRSFPSQTISLCCRGSLALLRKHHEEVGLTCPQKRHFNYVAICSCLITIQKQSNRFKSLISEIVESKERCCFWKIALWRNMCMSYLC